MRDPGVAKFAVAMLTRAIQDMNVGREKGDAVLWLASNAATPYFDMANIDQQSALQRIGWALHAERALWTHRNRFPMYTDDECEILRAGIDFINGSRENSNPPHIYPQYDRS